MDTGARRSDKRHTHHGPTGGDAGLTTHSLLKDPVCSTTVTATSPHRLEHDGHPFWFYFCSARCQAKVRRAAGSLRSAGCRNLACLFVVGVCLPRRNGPRFLHISLESPCPTESSSTRNELDEQEHDLSLASRPS